MTNEERTKVWNEAAQWGFNRAFDDLLHGTDKAELLLVLFRKAAELADECEKHDNHNAARWEAYSEGFRHALNILECLGANSLETYNSIINPSIHMKVTEEDIKRLR